MWWGEVEGGLGSGSGGEGLVGCCFVGGLVGEEGEEEAYVQSPEGEGYPDCH